MALAALAGIPGRSATGVPRGLSLPRGLRSLLSSRAARGLSATGMSASWAGRSTRDRRSPRPSGLATLRCMRSIFSFVLAFMLGKAIGFRPTSSLRMSTSACDISRQRPSADQTS